jgi:hypothetical protein
MICTINLHRGLLNVVIIPMKPFRRGYLRLLLVYQIYQLCRTSNDWHYIISSALMTLDAAAMLLIRIHRCASYVLHYPLV